MANAIQVNLDHIAEVTVWTQGIFKLSQTAIQSLMDALYTFDFAVFVFAPDDVVKMRGKRLSTVRDNVVFELGLFVGRIGRDRSFIVLPRGEDLQLPTDLAGITPGTYAPDRADRNLVAALGSACTSISRAIENVGAAAAGEMVKQSGFEFFPERATLNNSRDLNTELQKARVIKMLLVGGSKLIEAQPYLENVEKVLLPHPESASLLHYAGTVGDEDALQKKIIGATKKLQSCGATVRWYQNMICHTMIIADPGKDTSWVQWESVFPFAALPSRPCVVVFRKRYPQLVAAIDHSFERMFAAADSPPRQKGRLEKRTS